MKTFLIILGVLVLLVALVVVLAIVFTPWMNRWHTTSEERAAAFPGDDLVADPKLVINRGVTIKAAPEKIYPWLLQIGADKAGMYSYTRLERLTGCVMAKDEVIREKWQSLKEGDLMKMCAGEFAPPPYIVAKVLPNEAVIFGHKEGDKWMETWQFLLVPQGDGSTRLLTRTSTNMVGGAWEVFNRIAFVMERKMLLTIKSLAETGHR
jgi:hypothetical protein